MKKCAVQQKQTIAVQLKKKKGERMSQDQVDRFFGSLGWVSLSLSSVFLKFLFSDLPLRSSRREGILREVVSEPAWVAVRKKRTSWERRASVCC